MGVTLLNYLPGIGMLAVGIGAIVIWFLLKGRRPVYFKYYIFGAIFWVIAIVPKYVMDYTVTRPIENVLLASLSLFAVAIALALYYGLRTGFFESGFTYLIVKYTGLGKMSFNEAVALGIGFGGIEAIYTCVLWLQESGPLFTTPQDPLSYIGVWERLFTLFCHVFAVVLVVYAVKLGDRRWLWLSIAYKALIDGPLVFLLVLQSGGLIGGGLTVTAIAESLVTVLGILGLIGLYWIDKKYGGGAPDAFKAGDPHSGD